MKNQITITISGKPKSGKSKIAYIIKEMIKIYDLNVEHELPPDYPDEQTFNRAMRGDIDEVLGAIKDSTVVVIKEIQEKNES